MVSICVLADVDCIHMTNCDYMPTISYYTITIE